MPLVLRSMHTSKRKTPPLQRVPQNQYSSLRESMPMKDERRHVATFDVPTTFLYAETDEDVVMRLEGRLAELMVKMDPSLYQKYITTSSRGKLILYVKCIRPYMA